LNPGDDDEGGLPDEEGSALSTAEVLSEVENNFCLSSI
jgi:hypothetical protein